jgi:serine/threonine-protein kinase
MSFEIGKTVGGYEFLDFLRMSKSEIRYRVRNVLAQRLEALRILPKTLQQDQEQVQRFLREMKVHARLVHPNIVTFYNALEIERELVMTTELLEGTTLAERLELGPLPWRDAISYVLQALAALAHAHAQGIIHRDITPEHMILIPDGTLKLSDFGLAKFVGSPQLTQVGTVLGTLKYISPEQVKGSVTLDGRADLYSLGVVLYEAVTGKVPFDSKSQFELMFAHVSEIPKAPSEVNPAVPKKLDPVILKAIAKEPAERFQTADEFRGAVENVKAALDGAAGDARPEAIRPSAPTQPASQWRAPTEVLPVAAPITTVSPGGEAAPLFGGVAASGWGTRELVIIGIAAGAMSFFVFVAYFLMGRG